MDNFARNIVRTAARNLTNRFLGVGYRLSSFYQPSRVSEGNLSAVRPASTFSRKPWWVQQVDEQMEQHENWNKLMKGEIFPSSKIGEDPTRIVKIVDLGDKSQETGDTNLKQTLCKVEEDNDVFESILYRANECTKKLEDYKNHGYNPTSFTILYNGIISLSQEYKRLLSSSAEPRCCALALTFDCDDKTAVNHGLAASPDEVKKLRDALSKQLDLWEKIEQTLAPISKVAKEELKKERQRLFELSQRSKPKAK